MKIIRQLPSWFAKQKLSGKLAIGCGSLFMIFCLCSFPAAMLSPSTLTPASTSIPIDVPAMQTSAAGTFIAGVDQKATEIVLTDTPELLDTPTVAFTDTVEFTDTPVFTPTITDTPQATLPAGIASCIPTNTLREFALVLGIIDGDSIYVQINGQTLQVDYIGIDAPETGKEYYGQAAQINQNLVYSKTVTLIKDVSETGNNGVLPRYVIVDNIFVNQEIVKSGYALAVSSTPDTACSSIFTSAQSQAQSGGIGLWIPTPIPVLPPAGGSGGGGNFDSNGDGKVTCGDFSTQFAAQQAYNAGYSNLDGNNDGRACESLP